MRKRSENCWLMHKRMVTAVATTSAQRQAPRQERTRVTSASCMLACGSSNTTGWAGATAVSLAEGDIVSPEAVFVFDCGRAKRRYSNPFGMLALVNAAARAFIQPSRNALSSDGGLDLP